MGSKWRNKTRGLVPKFIMLICLLHINDRPFDPCERVLTSFSRVNPDAIGCMWTGEFDLNKLRMDGEIFESGRKSCGFKNIRIRVDGTLKSLN